jgi:hypothetical protein
VLLGRGRRLFEVLPSHIELAIARMIDTPDHPYPHRVRREPVLYSVRTTDQKAGWPGVVGDEMVLRSWSSGRGCR